jgi:hypothetical protein
MPLDATIKVKVQEFISKEEMFTSVDIANAIKQDGIWIKNREVRDWLRANVSDTALFGDYAHTQIQVCCGTATATLYYPMFKDPDDYQKRDQVALTPDEVKAIQKTKIGQPVASATPDINQVFDASDDDVDASAVIKTTERIKIPGHIIKKLGWAPGDRIDPALIKTHRALPSDLYVNADYRVSIPRSVVDWGKDPVKVILRKGEIVFDKA